MRLKEKTMAVVESVDMYPTTVEATFDWTEHVELIPEEVKEQVTQLFTSHGIGSKSRLVLFERLVKLAQRRYNVAQELIHSFDRAGGRRGFPKGVMATQRKELETYRTLLLSLPDEVLKAIATEKNVDFNSYMRSQDKNGLICAILEETA